MNKNDEGKTVIIKHIDAMDERRAIQVGDRGEIDCYDEAGLPCILFKTGLAKGSIYCMSIEQLKVVGMIKIKYNIGSKPHKIEFKNYEELGKWVVNNYKLQIMDITEN